MKILHISSSDSGGAGIAALRLNLALCNSDVDSKVLCLHKTSNYKSVVKYKEPIISKLLSHSHIPYGQNRYLNHIDTLDSAYEAVSFPKAFFDVSKSKEVREADIINLHWVGNMLNYHNFFKNVRKPIVWTLHDMNPFLGIAHYMGDYNKNYEFAEIEKSVAKYKKDSMAQHSDLHIVNLCNWMMSYSSQSEVFRNRPHSVIANSINIDIFKPYNKQFCRELLGLPTNRPIILFCSQGVGTKRKGFEVLLKALPYVSQDCFFSIVGETYNQLFDCGIDYKIFGTIRDELLLAFIYSAADVFVLPSIEDNLPNTMLESLACGTPMVSFENGGMYDILKQGRLGLLVEEQSPQALSAGINRVVNTLPQYNSSLISTMAHSMFNPKKQAEEYIQLYRSILN
jgi:glycosyltransferase involved in cell wall biosynthesis